MKILTVYFLASTNVEEDMDGMATVINRRDALRAIKVHQVCLYLTLYIIVHILISIYYT